MSGVVEAVLIGLAAVTATVTLIGVVAAWQHHAQPAQPTREGLLAAFAGRLPAVSILKPCKGADPALAENLRSWLDCLEPGWELLIGVAEVTDPAAEIARELLRAHPGRNARLIITGLAGSPLTNPKVANLIALEREASGALTLVSDSNVRATPGLMASVLLGLARPEISASYALFFASPPASAPIASRLEAAVFSTLVLPSIAGGYRVFKTPNLIGKVMLIRRDVLRALGGWERYTRYLVEDGRLGRDLRAAKHGIVLAPVLAQVELGSMSWRQLWEHEVRWTILHRVTLPLVPVGMVLWNPLFLAIAAVTATGFGMTAAAAALGLAALHNLAIKAIPFLRFGGRVRDLCMLPVLDALYLAVTLWIWTTRTVVWRGRRFRLGSGSYIEAVEP